MFPAVPFLLGLAGRFAVSKLLVYAPRVLAVLAGAGAVSTVIKSDDDSSPVPSSSSSSDVSTKIKQEIDNLSNNLKSDVSLNVPSSNYVEESFTVSSTTLIDVLSQGVEENIKTREKITKAIYDLIDVISASTVALTRVLDDGFSSVAVSNLSSSVAPVVNPVFSPNILNSVNVDTSPIATTLKPAVDSISDKLDSQKRYYDKVLTPSSIRDLDGNIVVDGVDSVDLDNIKKAVISKALTDLNNLNELDFDDDLDFDDLLSGVDFSQLFNLIKLSNQLNNNGAV